MKENYELYEHIYQDAEMACYTIEILSKKLKDKDNKIKSILEDILKDYTCYKEKSKEFLEKNNKEVNEKDFKSKIMAKMGIKKEVKADNSDSAIVELLIQGISMGSIEIERKINSYDKEVNKDEIKFAEKFKEFQQKSISKLKKYL